MRAVPEGVNAQEILLDRAGGRHDDQETGRRERDLVIHQCFEVCGAMGKKD